MIKTLDPANGLTRGWRVAPPQRSEPPLWNVAVDIGGLAVRGRTIDEYPVHIVGACGVSRKDTISRAAGEAVERFALFPGERGPDAIKATSDALGDTALDFEGLGDARAEGRPLRWYRGRRLGSGESVWVPAGLVDYPAEDPWFDPTPSGAAAGPTREFALRGALLELIERDAVSVAWAADVELEEFDVEAEIAAARPTADWRHLTRLYRSVCAQGLQPRLLRVPVLPGFHCVLGAVIDGGRAAVGAKAHEELGRALLIALQESLQVREALRRIGRRTVPEVVRDDMDRAALWQTESAVTELDRRLRGLATTEPGATSRPPHSLTDLVAAVVADGGRPVAVDLTARLPPEHRAMGWHAIKVVVAGYQPLRMDERHEFTWQRARIAAAATKPVRYFPHPLI
ncbi:YcaO-like family protein [Amycolatopsis sp. WAC 01376]|uniref:YcaO-like family protein n=1 Tax=Amycolatopsis sp. WAC 01376 TaxID=2203195 RepID=UPI001F217185|nr:YcaO-like family protein [Amycolatopsis sp. WAC 01376]